MCFGGSSSPAPTPAAPKPDTNTPSPPGSDAFQRFQEIRAGLLSGQTQLIAPPTDEKLGTTKGTTVTGAQ